jgi:Lrp/AsnC family leucine-responsive transcriptional regulator
LDAVDIRICQMLMQDSRVPIREIGKRLNLTVAAVHRRVQTLQDLGIIKAYTGNLSLNHLGAVSILIHGYAKGNANEFSEKLDKDDRTYALLVAAGNYVFVMGCLERIEHLDAYAEHIRDVCDIESPVVGIEVFGPPGQTRMPESGSYELDDVDLDIIRALHWDSRKQIASIASEVGVSAKTVRRRLSALREKDKIELVIQWHPDASDDIISFTLLELPSGANRYELGKELMQLGPRIVFFRTFSNQPESLLLVTWSKTMKELKGLLDEVGENPMVKSLVPYIVYTGYRYQTWRDRLLDI